MENFAFCIELWRFRVSGGCCNESVWNWPREGLRWNRQNVQRRAIRSREVKWAFARHFHIKMRYKWIELQLLSRSPQHLYTTKSGMFENMRQLEQEIGESLYTIIEFHTIFRSIYIFRKCFVQSNAFSHFWST